MTVAVAADGDTVPWLAVRSLDDTNGDITNLELKQREGRLEVRVDSPLMVCAGSEGAATQCKLIDALYEDRVDFALTPGVEVHGVLRGMNVDARPAVLRIRPADLEARRSVVVPLFRFSNALAGGIDVTAGRPFEICHLAPGRYLFEFTLADGYVQAFDDVIIQEPAGHRIVQLGTFSIDPGVAMAIDVTNEERVPVPGAIVGVSQPDDTQPGGRRIAQAHADDRGRAVLRHLAPVAPALVGCVAPGFARTQDNLPTPTNTHTCVLRRLAGIAGTVRDDQGPIPNAAVSIAGVAKTVTGSDGRFLIDDLTPAGYYLQVVAPGYGRAEREAAAVAGLTVDAGTILLTPGETATGRIIDDITSQPVVAANVTIPGRPENGAVTADDHGRFRLVLDPTGEAIRITAVGYADFDGHLTPAADEQEFRLERPGALSVQVWHKGRPCVGCIVTADGPARGWSARTSATGEAHFERLGPGTYYVGYETARAATTHVSVSGASSKSAEVRPGSTTNIELGSPQQTIDVYLTPAPDESWRLVAFTGTTSNVAQRNEQGIFFIERPEQPADLILSRGELSVVVATIAPQYAASSVAIALPPGTVALTIPPAKASTRGMFEVRTLRGEPVAWAPLRSDVTYTIPYLRTDTYMITAGGKQLSTPFATGPGMTAVSLQP